MKLASIAPFTSAPEPDSDARLEAREISQNSERPTPVDTHNNERPLKKATDEETKKGVERFAQFMRKHGQKEKSKSQNLSFYSERGRMILSYLKIKDKNQKPGTQYETAA